MITVKRVEHLLICCWIFAGLYMSPNYSYRTLMHILLPGDVTSKTPMFWKLSQSIIVLVRKHLSCTVYIKHQLTFWYEYGTCKTAICCVRTPSAATESPGANALMSWAAYRKIKRLKPVQNKPASRLMLATKCCPSSFCRLLRAAVMAVWKGPLIPPSIVRKNPGTIDA